jgi:PAS domain S-box-containing protein
MTRVAQMQRLRSLFQQAPGLFAVTRGRDHVYEIANPAYFEFVGRENIIGLTVREALPELDEKFIRQLTEVFDTGQPYIGRRIPIGLRRAADGAIEDRIVDFVFQPIVGDDQRVDGIFVQGTDITEQAAAEAKLHASEARFRTITNAMPQMVWSALPDGCFDYFNQQWFDYTGLPSGEPDRDPWARVLHPEDAPDTRLRWRRSLETGQDFESQYRLRHHSGDYRWVLGRAVPVREGDQIIRWLGTGTDIHDHRKAQEGLERSERALREADRRKDEFLAMLAHELRNPLAPIGTAAQLLMLSSDPARTRAVGEVIGRQVRHMTELVDDLLDVSRVTRGLVQLEIETINLKEVINGAIEQVRSLIDARRHALRTRLAAADVWVEGDRTRLVQIFANLLNNAAKYTPDGGEVDLDLEVEGKGAVVHVRDNGQGIENRLLPHIFDLFTQAERSPDRAQGGLGIGLALVRSLVSLHGGSISVASEGRDRGATFTVRLPAVDAPAAVGALGQREARLDAPLDVVVVDDNIDAGETLKVLLELMGHRVRVFHRALEALDDVVNDPPDVAFLDIGLPDVTGHQLAREIRERLGPRTPLLAALSGYGQPQDLAASRVAGLDFHLIKPPDQGKLREVLLSALQRTAPGERPGAAPRGR